MALKTFILAAGLGTRLRPYTQYVPKPAVPFMGIPLLGYPMYLAHNAGVSEMILNTHPMADKIHAAVDLHNHSEFHIQYSHEDSEPKGSGGALYHAKDLLDGATDFFVINGDTVFIPKNENLFRDLYTYHQSQNALCTLVVSEDPELVRQFNPLWINGQGHVVSIGAKPSDPNCRPVHYLGVKVFQNRVFQYIPSGVTSLFSDVLGPAIKKGEVVATTTEEGFWWETGNFDAFFKATKEAMHLISDKKDNSFFQHIYTWARKSLVFSIHKKGDDIVFLHSSSAIPLNAISGSAFIDDNTNIDANVQLKDVVVNSGCHVTASTTNAMFLKDMK